MMVNKKVIFTFGIEEYENITTIPQVSACGIVLSTM